MNIKSVSESDPFQPTGKILAPDGTDVSDRDRSDDGTIVIRRNREVGHNYFFGNWPTLPWHKVECPKCRGRGTVPIEESPEYTRYCDLCEASGKVKEAVRKKFTTGRLNMNDIRKERK